MNFKPLSEIEESIAERIVDAAFDEMNPVWQAQILSHLKLTNKRRGFYSTLMCHSSKMVYKDLFYNLSAFMALWHARVVAIAF